MSRTLARRITRAPRPYDAARAADTAAAWPDAARPLADLLVGAAGCSPYLYGLIRREADWLAPTLDCPPEASMVGLLGDIASEGDTAAILRRAKRRAALLIALCDLGGVWSLETVTGALTDLADAAVARALDAALRPVVARGRLPGMTADDVADGAGMVVLAMGKMGAGELNYSSDIDLICLYDDSRFATADLAAARAGYVRATRAMCALLSDVTADGYVFRTDLRLRPDPGATPVCLSMDAAERYYESVGRAWERAAHIKARACAGDVDSGARYLRRLDPFVWRRHLDFAAIRDAHDMRLSIRRHRGFGARIDVPGHDLKLGRGGIREIEFFTQTRQIIAGGRDPSLRVPGTVIGLDRLAAAGWIAPELAAELAADYRRLRTAEHRLQMIGDAQTHVVPAGAEGIARVAALDGRDADGWRDAIGAVLHRVAARAEAFFAPDAAPDAGPHDAPPELTPAQRAVVAGWRAAPALRSPRAQELFDGLRPALLGRLLSGARPDAALAAFDGFLRGLPAGVQLFSLFQANPALIDLIADIADTAPDLAAYLARNAAVLDAVVGGDFFAPWPGTDALCGDLAGRMAAVPDQEAQLDAARAWLRDWRFRVGVHHLRGLIDAAEAGAHYAGLARAVLGAVWPAVCAAFARRHGAAPGRGAMVLALGSIGAGWGTAKSDLDLIVIYDAPGAAASDGPRPLPARTYYTRLTQALVTALSAPMARGDLYQVDMRLRPSGRQGPVATSLDAFTAYQRDDAWTWEHLALMRARPVAGAPGLIEDVAAVLAEIAARPRNVGAAMADVAAMRARMDEGPVPPWELRRGPGRLQDIELAAAALALCAGDWHRDVPGQVAAGVRAGLIAPDRAARMTAAYDRMMRMRTVARLLNGDRIDPATLGGGGTALLARETGILLGLDALAAALAADAKRAAEDVAVVLGIAAPAE